MLLARMGREGNDLSGVLRQAWDSGLLYSSTKNSPAKSTEKPAHVSVVAHVTAIALREQLTRCDTANGFANRFIWLCAQRSQELPHGGKIGTADFTQVVNYLRDTTQWVMTEFDGDKAPVVRDPPANRYWEEIYHDLSEAKPGMLGSVLGRGEAQVMRLALIYALLDRSTWIQRPHLEAATAFWRYSERSAAFVFGEQFVDKEAEKLLAALRAAANGLTSTEISTQVFKKHKRKEEIAEKLSMLAKDGQIRREENKDGRHTTTRWKAVQRIAAKPQGGEGDGANSANSRIGETPEF
jgi:hypothetical protein